MEAIGRKRWAIAEGYIPSESSFSDRALISHETACILNGDRDAQIVITIFFANREPAPLPRDRRRAAHATCASTISTIRRRSRAIPTRSVFELDADHRAAYAV